LHPSVRMIYSTSECRRNFRFIEDVLKDRSNWEWRLSQVKRLNDYQVDIRIGLSSVLRPRQHSIGYMGLGDSFYRSKDPTNSIKVLKE